METTERVTRSAGIVSLGIGASRILGYLRDMLIASRFGGGAVTDAFFVAFMIPNLLRDLLAEGALSAAFIPVFTEYLTTRGKKETWVLASRIVNLLVAVTSIIIIIGIFITPFVFSFIPEGLIRGGDPQLASRLLQIMFPFIIFISLAALTMGILNSLGRFGLPSFASVMLNVILIGSIFLFWRPGFDEREAIIGLAVAVLIGGAAQFLIQIPGLRREKMEYSPLFGLRDNEGVRKIGLLMVPRAIGAAAYQVNTLVCRLLAWTISPGWVFCLYLANRLVLLPVSLFGVSLTTALFPTLARQAAAGEMSELKKSLSSSLRTLLFLAVPSSIGLMVLGRPIVQVLFERQAFTAQNTNFTYMALWFYSLGIFGYGGAKLVSSCFYALQDTKTPVTISIFSMGLNLVFSLFLMEGLEGGGLALATSLSSLFNLALLLGVLRRRIGRLGGWKILAVFFKALLASVIMGLVSHWMVCSIGVGVMGVSFAILIGVATLFILSRILRIEESTLILKLIRRQRTEWKRMSKMPKI